MKEYVKPRLDIITLRLEERIAACDDKAELVGPTTACPPAQNCWQYSHDES